MLLVDVNVFIYATRRDSEEHHEYRAWLEDRLSGLEPFGVSELVLSSVVRIITNRRVFRIPSTIVESLEFCDAVLAGPASVPLRPGPRHWALFTDLCRRTGARGNLVPDAYVAALAVEHGATLVTTDRGMFRFPGVQVELPFGDAPT